MKFITCKICGKKIKQRGNAQKFCFACSHAHNIIYSRKYGMQKYKERKERWDNLSEKEKTKVMKDTVEYYKIKEEEQNKK